MGLDPLWPRAAREQSQALALQEARCAFEDGRTVPHRFAVAAKGEARIVTDALREELRPATPCSSTSSSAATCSCSSTGAASSAGTSPPSLSPRSLAPGGSLVQLDGLLRALRGWTQGVGHPAVRPGELAACSATNPDKALTTTRVCSPPHRPARRPLPRAVWQALGGGRPAPAPLFHEPAPHRPARRGERRGPRARPSAQRPALGLLLGPAVDHALEEERSIRRGAGRIAPLVHVETVDSASTGLEQPSPGIGEYDVLHSPLVTARKAEARSIACAHPRPRPSSCRAASAPPACKMESAGWHGSGAHHHRRHGLVAAAEQSTNAIHRVGGG